MGRREDFVAQFRELHPKFSRMYVQMLGKVDLSLPQYTLLYQLMLLGTVSMTEISERLEISKPAVTNLVDRLEEKKLLRRLPHKKDRRVILLEILPKAKEIIVEIQKQSLAPLLKAYDRFSAIEHEPLSRFFATVSKIMDDLLSQSKKRAKKLLSFFFVLGISSLPILHAQEKIASHAPSEPPSLSLEECYRLALIQSETVAIQKEAIARASAQIFNAASQGLGNVDFIVNRTLQDGQKNTLGDAIGDPNVHESKFTISQPLFQGFKAIGALSGAGSYRREQTEAWLRAKELLYADVARAFYNVLRYEKEIEINQGIRELLGKRIKELEDREKIGRSRMSEVITAKTNLKILEADLASAQGALATVRYLLEFLTGTDLEERQLKEETSEEVSSQTLTEHLKMASVRSDVKSAEQAVKTAWRGILVAQSGFWPTITLDHNRYMRREGILSNLDWDTLFKFDVPLFSGGETVGQVKDSISILKQKKLSFSLTKRQAELDIKQSYQIWVSAKETNDLLKEAVRDAENNYEIQSEEYTRSLVSNLDVLAALESLHNTRQRQNLTYYVMKQDEAAFRVATGEVS